MGKSTARRNDRRGASARSGCSTFLSLVVIGLAAGAVFTSSALQPVRDLIATVRQIMRTGRILRGSTRGTPGTRSISSACLFNAMLDRIQALIGGSERWTTSPTT